MGVCACEQQKNANPLLAIAISCVGRRLLLGEYTAEGVETNEQLNFLQENQCDEFQDFLISKPVTATACEKLLRDKLKN